MKKIYILFLVLISLLVIGVVLVIARMESQRNTALTPAGSKNENVLPDTTSPKDAPPSPSNNASSGFIAPLDRSAERVTKKPFGTYITPETSPVQPERFRGYHAGTDFEIFPEELNADVSVHAVCDGTLLQKKYASGYGGVAVESCELDGNPITVIYGHLKLESISSSSGEKLNAGDTIGILGKDKSVETDGERKHLHLGFHKGSSVTLRGYVDTKAGLSDWIDPCTYVCSP